MAGAPRPPEAVRAAIVEPARGGAPTSALVRYARAQDVFALARPRWTLDDLKAWVRAGVAPVVLVATRPMIAGRFHYLLLTGYDDRERVLLLRDGAREIALDYDEFFPRWCEARGFALALCAPGIALPEDRCGLTPSELGALGWLAERTGALEAARRHYRAALAEDPGFTAAAVNLRNVERRLARAR
jgi:hypothetical protein